MVTFTPISDQEEKKLRTRLIPDGTILDFVVIPEITYPNGGGQVTEMKKSKSDNLRLNTVLELYNEDGNKICTLTDKTNMFEGKMAWKGKHFCESLGLHKEYNEADLDKIVAACIGKSGKCKIGIEKGNDGYPNDKNIIKDYVIIAPQPIAEEIDDDIPL